MDTTNPTPCKVLVVLGAPTTADAKPGSDLQQRLDFVIQQKLHEQHQWIVVTGGNPPTYGSGAVKEEGIIMKEYLLSNNVPEDQILVEPRSFHTFHNALYSKTLLGQHKIAPQEITVLTHDWHMPRSFLCFQVAFCDTSVQLQPIAVPGDLQDPTVQNRLYSERNLVSHWMPRCLQEEKDSPDMPREKLAFNTLIYSMEETVTQLDSIIQKIPRSK